MRSPSAPPHFSPKYGLLMMHFRVVSRGPLTADCLRLVPTVGKNLSATPHALCPHELGVWGGVAGFRTSRPRAMAKTAGGDWNQDRAALADRFSECFLSWPPPLCRRAPQLHNIHGREPRTSNTNKKKHRWGGGASLSPRIGVLSLIISPRALSWWRARFTGGGKPKQGSKEHACN